MLVKLSRFDPRRVYFGWWIVLAGAVNGLVMVGVTQYAFGLFINPMRTELGWPVAMIAAASSIRSFENGFMSPVTGYMMDKLGPKLITNMGIVVMAAGLVMFSQVHQVWLYFASAAVIALGQSLAGGNAFNIAIVNWFEKKRARAIGFARSGSGVGSLTVPPLVLLISIFGWRHALIVLAIFVLLMGTVLRLFLRAPHPEDMGYLPDGGRIADQTDGALAVRERPQGGRGTGRGGRRNSGDGMEVKEAVRTPAFYLMCLASSFRSCVHTTWLVLYIPHLQNVGFPPAIVATLAAGYGTTQLGWRLLVAWTGDRMGRRRVLLASFVLQAVGMLAFAWVSPQRLWLVPIWFIIYGWGNAAWSTMDSTQMADYFGTKRYATLSGLKGSLAVPLGLATPIIAGFAFDRMGTYSYIWTVYAFIFLLGGLSIWAIRRPLWTFYQERAREAEEARAAAASGG